MSKLDSLVTGEQIYAELRKLRDAGALEYVLPSWPPGGQWVVGVRGINVVLAGKAEAMAFLAGVIAGFGYLLNDEYGEVPEDGSGG